MQLIHEELATLNNYTKGWNGPRSLAADARSFDLAHAFVDLLDTSKLSISATIFSIGTAVLEITHGENKLLIEFAANGDLAINVDTPEDQFDHDLTGFDGSQIPEEIRQFL